jgi:lysophospholipase L1-like esterase
MIQLRTTTTTLSFLAIPCALCVALTVAGCSDDATGTGTGGNDDTAADAATAGDATAGTGNSGPGTGGVDDTAGTGAGPDTGVDTGADTGEPGGVECVDAQFVNGASPGPDYSEFNVPIGSHCQGTNQQDITEIERVVFLGDSVTVGTPPTPAADFYRSILANELATLLDLQPPELQWMQANPITGTSGVQESGDFANCSVWGARNDDLLSQLEDCFAPEDFQQRTLVITTMGGNDASSIAQDAINGTPANELFTQLEDMVAAHEMAVDWLTADPDTFPNGVFVVNANVYEYTDYTVDVVSCPAAGVVGFNMNPENPDLLLASLNLMNEEYMRIAEESGTDVVFMFEGFCGHGFHADDPANPCYRGPGSERWFDATCIHPNPPGHAALAEMFVNVIAE